MGILFALVPIGGFAEPDDEQLFGKKEIVKKELPLTATIEEIEEWEQKGNKWGEWGKNEGFEAKKTYLKDEKTVTRTQRMRILASGVMANFTVAFIAFLLFFGPVLGAIAPLSDAMVLKVNESSPANLAGIQKGVIITQVDDTNIATSLDLMTYLEKVKPGVPVGLMRKKTVLFSVLFK